jgi:hypothetical protein
MSSVAAWLGLAASVCTIVLAIMVMWRLFIREVAAAVHRIEKQVTPNGGHTNTLGDRVQRIEEKVTATVEE